MAKIAYILLCHQDPDAIVQQANRLLAGGDFVSIHFDANASDADFKLISDAVGDNPDVVFARRIKCGWGEWSLVQATLNALQAAENAFPKATHFYLVSGDCMPIKSAHFVHAFLDENNQDFIESFDYFSSDWIKTGMKEERLIYRHYINERSHKKLFYTSLALQKRLGLKRKIPKDLEIMIGSQWWCLRRRTIESILDFLAQRKDVIRFFKTTWIPDETFFQTLVRHLVPHREIEPRTLTFLMFSDYGMPVNFYNDQFDLLLSQNFMFARKISPEATELKAKLGTLYASGQNDFQISDEGRRLYQYLAQRGRHGQRFAPRFWERDSTLGRERELLILVCKKWHVAKRLLAAIKHATNLPGVEFLFDEMETGLPHLGGIENSMEKRTRHRRAVMRMLFDYYDSNRLMICLDPNNLDMMRDFYSDRCTTKLLEIDCVFDDAYLIGHARRAGFAGGGTSDEALAELVPTIRQEFALESDAIREAGFTNTHLLREAGSDAENTAALSQFLNLSEDAASELAKTPHLFTE